MPEDAGAIDVGVSWYCQRMLVLAGTIDVGIGASEFKLRLDGDEDSSCISCDKRGVNRLREKGFEVSRGGESEMDLDEDKEDNEEEDDDSFISEGGNRSCEEDDEDFLCISCDKRGANRLSEKGIDVSRGGESETNLDEDEEDKEDNEEEDDDSFIPEGGNRSWEEEGVNANSEGEMELEEDSPFMRGEEEGVNVNGEGEFKLDRADEDEDEDEESRFK